MTSDGGQVRRTLSALELLSAGPVSRTELARRLEVHPRTVSRLLATLVDEGYATPAPAAAGRGRHYQATLRLVALAGRVLDRTDLVRIAFPYVTRLRNRTSEAAHLSIPGDSAVMHLIQETAENVVMVKPRVGEQVGYHCTAVGKALLAFDSERWERLRASRLERRTEHTLTDPGELLVELANIRKRGYAVDDLENDIALRCVAAPVFDHAGRAVAALGVSAPASRLQPDQLDALSMSVRDISAQLSHTLGYVELASGAVAAVAEGADELAVADHADPGGSSP